jgi:hypothetical protein
VLQFLERLGDALNRGVHFQPTPNVAELCSLYPTRADAVAAMQQIRRLRVMCLASDQDLATLERGGSKPRGCACEALDRKVPG